MALSAQEATEQRNKMMAMESYIQRLLDELDAIRRERAPDWSFSADAQGDSRHAGQHASSGDGAAADGSKSDGRRRQPCSSMPSRSPDSGTLNIHNGGSSLGGKRPRQSPPSPVRGDASPWATHGTASHQDSNRASPADRDVRNPGIRTAYQDMPCGQLEACVRPPTVSGGNGGARSPASPASQRSTREVRYDMRKVLAANDRVQRFLIYAGHQTALSGTDPEEKAVQVVRSLNQILSKIRSSMLVIISEGFIGTALCAPPDVRAQARRASACTINNNWALRTAHVVLPFHHLNDKDAKKRITKLMWGLRCQVFFHTRRAIVRAVKHLTDVALESLEFDQRKKVYSPVDVYARMILKIKLLGDDVKEIYPIFIKTMLLIPWRKGHLKMKKRKTPTVETTFGASIKDMAIEVVNPLLITAIGTLMIWRTPSGGMPTAFNGGLDVRREIECTIEAIYPNDCHGPLYADSLLRDRLWIALYTFATARGRPLAKLVEMNPGDITEGVALRALAPYADLSDKRFLKLLKGVDVKVPTTQNAGTRRTGTKRRVLGRSKDEKECRVVDGLENAKDVGTTKQAASMGKNPSPVAQESSSMDTNVRVEELTSNVGGIPKIEVSSMMWDV